MKKNLPKKKKCGRMPDRNNRVTGWMASILHRMGVIRMDRKKKDNKKKNDKLFDFKDLMAFGMFILALLTFIYLICH